MPEYMTPRHPWARNESELAALRAEREELRAELSEVGARGREFSPTAMPARARLGEVEREIAAAEAAGDSGAVVRLSSPVAPARARAARQQFMPIVAYFQPQTVSQASRWRPVKRATLGLAGNFDPRRFTLPAGLANADFATRWAALFEAGHPGEHAFVTT